MIYDLFLDDLRELDYIFPSSLESLSCKDKKIYERKDWNWTICRTYSEAVKLVEKQGVPRMMSLDHDLGEEKSGKDFLNHLIELDLDGKIDLSRVERFTCHSANISGRENILKLWSNFMESKYGYQFI